MNRKNGISIAELYEGSNYSKFNLIKSLLRPLVFSLSLSLSHKNMLIWRRQILCIIGKVKENEKKVVEIV